MAAQKTSTFIRVSAESGGTLQNFYTPKVITNEGLEPFQFLRFSFDLRRNIVLNKTTSVAYRFNTGVGYAYSSNKVLPYEKNFFVGGSNSVRAWRPRRLGPGELAPDTSVNVTQNGYYDYRFERPGDMLIEASIEYRQKLFGFVNYAVFVDAGNVWTIGKQTSELSRFDVKKFTKQLGVGTGFGLRFDFTFLILRFDIGIKAWDPARPNGEQFVLNKFRFFKPFSFSREPVIYNVGIGYPF
jgi:outer membrane protein insertion porin family